MSDAVSDKMDTDIEDAVDTDIEDDDIEDTIHFPLEPDIPEHLRTVLKDYQIDGIKFMYDRIINNTGCVLGHEMG
jgi:SNF2 family DNA or RNA helicase